MIYGEGGIMMRRSTALDRHAWGLFRSGRTSAAKGGKAAKTALKQNGKLEFN